MIGAGDGPWVLLLAVAIDVVVGDPPWLWRRLPHPVVWIGRAVGGLDRSLNRSGWSGTGRRLSGVAALAVLLAGAVAVGLLVDRVLSAVLLGWVLEAVLVAILLAQNSLFDHVGEVARALRQEGLAEGRTAVGRIVGRDTAALDQAGVCRAAIESCAENYSDGVVAPAFWYLIGGLPAMLAYKALNTADSLIGHRSDRYRDFGWASARLDDLANLVPARLTGIAIVVAAGVLAPIVRRTDGGARQAWRAMWRDARRHRSPNAGWPEAAMAGALGLALAGPRVYGGERVEDATLNEGGRAEAAPRDIDLAVGTALVAGIVLVLVVGALTVVWIR